MTVRTSYRIGLAILATLVATGCASTPKEPLEPLVRTVEVVVEKPVACPALVELGDEPAYADSDAALAAAGNFAQLAQLYAIGRKQRIQRLAEYVAAKTGCIF